MVIVHVVVACIGSELLDGSNFIQSAETIDETPWFRRAGGAYAGRVQRNFKAQFASIPATSKDVGEFGALGGLEITMPKINLSGMTVEALVDLRKRVDETLHKRRAELQQQLAALGVTRVVRGGGSALKGRKVPPKYRSPSGETWAGRGARPRWLVAALKRGKKLEQFLIHKPMPKRKRWAKRQKRA